VPRESASGVLHHADEESAGVRPEGHRVFFASVVPALIPKSKGVRYYRPTGKHTLGQKRNMCIAAAKGDLIAHWDDDDWYASNRLSLQVAALGDASICGLDTVLFYDLTKKAGYVYRFPNRPYVYSPTLIYTREFWAASPFPDQQVGSSTPFVWGTPDRLKDAVILHEYDWFVGMVHPGNTSEKSGFPAPFYTPYRGAVKTQIGADWAFYQGLKL
jgi:glycosyltransferase involved in cell wall biosynthesis